MNKKLLLTVCLALLSSTTNLFAANLVSCSGLIGTHWQDKADKAFGRIYLSFDYQSGDPFSNNNLIHYTLEYTMNGGDHIVHGATTSATHCTAQPDGSAYIDLGFDDGLSHLLLQASGDRTFNVASGSQLDHGSNSATPLKGPFIRV